MTNKRANGQVQTPEELKAHLVIVTNMLQYSKYLGGNAKAMLLGKYDIYMFIKRNSFLVNARNLFFDQCLIELYKLYSGGDDDFCIRKLLAHLLRVSEEAVWNDNVPVDLIKTWQADLENPMMKSKIKDLIILRNNYLAHTAKKRPKKHIHFFHDDIFDLIKYGEGIVNGLSTKILGVPVPMVDYDGKDSISFLQTCVENETYVNVHKMKNREA